MYYSSYPNHTKKLVATIKALYCAFKVQVDASCCTKLQHQKHTTKKAFLRCCFADLTINKREILTYPIMKDAFEQSIKLAFSNFLLYFYFAFDELLMVRRISGLCSATNCISRIAESTIPPEL